LLFVAISVAPERLLAEDAAQSHRVRASAALTSFTNALTVSLFGLVPDMDIGWPALVVGIVGLLFVAGSLLSLLRVRRSQPGELGDAAFLVGLVVVFCLQVLYGARVIHHDGQGGPITGICVLVVVCFLVGIARSWELIGGPSLGLWNELGRAIRRREASAEAARPDDPL
jgi:hypothetical protein